METVDITKTLPPTPATNMDDDEWLYEGSTNTDVANSTADPDPDLAPKSNLDANATEFVSKYPQQNGKGKPEHSDDASDDSEDDDDDDDVQITIGSISKSAPAPYGMPAYQPPQITPITTPKTVSVITVPPSTITTSTATATAAGTAGTATSLSGGPVLTASSKRTIDVNAVGNINGVPIYDYDIDTMCEEKPWRIPGADITDYFNYGFNEESWKAYCDKQKTVRGVAAEKNKELGQVTTTIISRTPLPELPIVPPPQVLPKQIGGTISVLGSKKDPPLPPAHPILGLSTPRLLVPGNIMFPHPLTQPTFLPPPTLVPPGLAPPPEIRPEIKQENPMNGGMLPPVSSAPAPGPLPPPMFQAPATMPTMLPPPSSIAPPLLLPPPLFGGSDDSAHSGEETEHRRSSRRRSHSRERKRSRERRSHRDRSSDHRTRSRRSPSSRKEKKRKSDRSSGDGSRHRHSHRRDESERSKRRRSKKDGSEKTENNENSNENTVTEH